MKRILKISYMLTAVLLLTTSCGIVPSGNGANNSNNSFIGGEHTHKFSIKWDKDETGHWHSCECGEKKGFQSHSGEAASCTTLPVCTTCGIQFGEASGHTYGQLKDGVDGKGYYCFCGESVQLSELVDFSVEVAANKEPVVLQLTDTQLTETDSAQGRCYSYIEETVKATKPDLILVTGDLIYGKFDNENGDIFTHYVNFMESLQIPWAPVFGNHDNECPRGVDWQCEVLENAQYCLFEQRELTGNGNYSVGILQSNKLLRVFYMLDSNGCGAPSEASADKVQTSGGLATDQMQWYTDSIIALKAFEKNVKISMAYHIQPYIFKDAFATYGFTNVAGEPLNLDTLNNVKNGDFGYLGNPLKTPWDSTYTHFNGVKSLGVDSIFVGHEHCNSASMVYQGVRLQYGQKSSRYDRFNSLTTENTIVGGHNVQGIALIGGTVFSLSMMDGTILNPYIYYAGMPTS